MEGMDEARARGRRDLTAEPGARFRGVAAAGAQHQPQSRPRRPRLPTISGAPRRTLLEPSVDAQGLTEWLRVGGPELSDSAWVDAADPWSWPPRSLRDAMDVGEESLDLLRTPKTGIRQAEHANSGSLDGADLGRTSAYRIVLRQDNPATFTREGNPLLIADSLGSVLAVDGCQCVRDETLGPERIRQLVSTEAAVDEELGCFRLRAGARHAPRPRGPLVEGRSPSPDPSVAHRRESGRAHRPSARRRR